MLKAQINRIGAKVKETKVGSMVTITVRVIMSEMANRNNNFNRGNYDNRNDRNGTYVPSQNREFTPRDGGDSIARVEDMLHKMIRRFDASDENIKELRSDLAGICQKSIHMQY